MTARTLSADDLPRLEPLVADYPFKPYRYYRALSRKAQQAVLIAEVRDTLAHRDGVAVGVGSDTVEAAAVGRVLEWETNFFGVAMARVEYILGGEAGQRGQAVDALIAELTARGARHLSARVDVADVETTGLLEARGFRLMDALVTYTTRPRKEPPLAVREVGTIRDFREADASELLDIAASAYRGFRGRFHLDPHLPDDRCDALYLEWARQAIRGAMADVVLVSEGADGRLLGFLSWRKREPVSSVGGVTVFGGGLGACRTDTPGAYAGLIRAGTIWAHDHDGVAECQTQNYNFSTVRIYEAVGAHYVRAEYTLHAWRG